MGIEAAVKCDAVTLPVTQIGRDLHRRGPAARDQLVMAVANNKGVCSIHVEILRQGA
jgi:hypothetical protein